MKTIEVKNPEFLANLLVDQIVQRTRYLVGQGLAYDSDWRTGFVELLQLLDQLECTCAEPEDGTQFERNVKFVDEALKEDRIIMKGSQVLIQSDDEFVWTVLDTNKGFAYLSRAHLGNPLGTVTRTALTNELTLL